MVPEKVLEVTITNTKSLTADDLLRLYSEGVRGELVRGVLSETIPTGYEHGKIVAKLTTRLGAFVESQNLGDLTASDSGVWLERNPDTVREPDIDYFLTEKMPAGVRVTGYAEVAPDLVVEVASPSDSHRHVNDKALMWLRYGVRLVWVVYPETRTVEAHREGYPVSSLTENDMLAGLDVLPGFACMVSDLLPAA